MPIHSVAIRHCQDLAANAAPAMAERIIDQAVAALQLAEQQSAGTSKRQELADAWLELLRQRPEWAARFPDLLRAGFATPEPTASPIAVAGNGRRTELTLVDDEAVIEQIESARLGQLLGPRLEQPLAELDALMSTALGLETVQPERNPLRPAVFARAMRSLVPASITPQCQALWTRHLAAPLSIELETLYQEALKLLRSADLQAASYRVLPIADTTKAARPAAPQPAPANGGGGAAGATATFAGAPGAPGAEGANVSALPTGKSGGQGAPLGGQSWADLSSYALGDELFQHFLFARAQPSSQGLGPSYYAQIDQQLAAVENESHVPYDPRSAQQHRDLAPVERPHRPVGTATPLDDAVWGRWGSARERSLVRTQLKKEARQVGQVLGLEVVRKLVDQVGQDPRLLPPVREAIVALEPALLRLALAAPRFFSQEEHAGRRLVERVAERSFKFNDEFASEFQGFFTEVRSIFQALNETGAADDVPFARALDHLEERWQQQDTQESGGRQVAVDAMHFAEKRQAEAAKIAAGLNQRSDMEGAPAVVQDFLFGPWSLVMAHARLTDGQRQIDPGGWTTVITDLLWSVKREQALSDVARFIATVPVMLDRLRAGLALLGQERNDHLTFFVALERLHRPVLKLRAKQRQSSSSPSSQPAEVEIDPALLSTERQQPRANAGAPWMAPDELEAAGFEDTQASAPAPLAAEDEMAPAHAAPSAADTPLSEGDVATLVEHLQLGCWVDLYSRNRWRRANLTWMSSHATLFMFVSHGGRPHSMTRRSLQRLARDRMMRPVEAGAVVERAIEQLSQPRALAA